jgi:hypothetical protein
MAKTIEVIGDERVIRDLQAKGDQATRLRPAMDDIADFAERQITPTWKSRSGDLTESLTGGSNQLRQIYDTGFNLGTTLYYGRFVIGGTSRQKPRPPRVNVNAIAREGANRVNREIERA